MIIHTSPSAHSVKVLEVRLETATSTIGSTKSYYSIYVDDERLASVFGIDGPPILLLPLGSLSTASRIKVPFSPPADRPPSKNFVRIVG
jgi:hypothetical protein